MDAPQTEVLVVGAGPVGQTAALLLARWGLRPILLDAAAGRGASGSKAICQHRDVLDVWSSVGAAAIADEGVTWSTARTFFRDAELFHLELPDPGASPLPAFVNISQARTEELLDGCLDRAGLQIRWGHEVVDLTQDDSGVTAVCRTDDGQLRLSAPFAVLAAGARAGGLRAALGVDFPGRSFDDAFLICDIRAEIPGWRNERRFYFDPPWNPGRQVLIHPCPDGQYRIDWQVEPGYRLDAELADGSLDARIRQVIGAVPYQLIWSSVYHFHSRCVPRMAVGRVLLAGDAAHLMAPFGARGLNSGVGDAENAAWKIAFTARGWGGPGLLGSYSDERHAAAVENLTVTGRTMDFLVPQTDELRARRLAVLQAALDDPIAREQVDSGRLSEPFWYTDSPLTTRAADRPWTGPPPRGRAPEPVSGVILPDAAVRAAGDETFTAVDRVRQLARSGVLLLCGDAAPAADTELAVRNALPAGTPLRVLPVRRFDGDGVLARALELDPAEVCVVRPDAYVAAYVTSPAAAAHAARRALGWS